MDSLFTVTGTLDTKESARAFRALLAGSGIAHDCILGNNVILANQASCGGHVQVGDFVFLGGSCAVHQFARLGR